MTDCGGAAYGCTCLALAFAATLIVLPLGCKARPQPNQLVATAKFGIFYGGQVQQREQIPFQLDRSQQEHGIRVDFTRPLERSVTVAWELDMPGGGRRVRDQEGRIGKGRLVKLGEAVVPSGRERFDQLLPFQPGDSLGTWNIRVLVDQQLVLDRPFLVYDAAARQRARESDGGRR